MHMALLLSSRLIRCNVSAQYNNARQRRASEPLNVVAGCGLGTAPKSEGPAEGEAPMNAEQLLEKRLQFLMKEQRCKEMKEQEN